MTALVVSWSTRNGPLQADVPVDYFAPSVTPQEGWQAVVKWYWRADSGDDWALMQTNIETPPSLSASYEPAADGWVKYVVYSILNGLASRETQEFLVEVVGGEIAEPQPYVDEEGDPYVDENGDPYMDKD